MAFNPNQYPSGIGPARKAVEQYSGPIGPEPKKQYKIKNYVSTLVDKLSEPGKKSKKPKKPKKVTINKLNAVKVVTNDARGYRLVREVEESPRVEDHRSLYFKDEFLKEREKERKWLS